MNSLLCSGRLNSSYQSNNLLKSRIGFLLMKIMPHLCLIQFLLFTISFSVLLTSRYTDYFKTSKSASHIIGFLNVYLLSLYLYHRIILLYRKLMHHPAEIKCKLLFLTPQWLEFFHAWIFCPMSKAQIISKFFLLASIPNSIIQSVLSV